MFRWRVGPLAGENFAHSVRDGKRGVKKAVS